MSTPDSVFRNQETRIGTIVQSDAANTILILKDDKFNSLLQISLHLHDDMAAMPAVGEKWMVRRVSNGTDWLLYKRMDVSTDPLPFSSLESGDRRIYAPGTLYLIADNIVTSTATTSGTASLIPSGLINMYGASTAPSGWLICDGKSYSPQTFPDLFKIIGTKYGSSLNSFKVPDLRSALPLGGIGGLTFIIKT